MRSHSQLLPARGLTLIEVCLVLALLVVIGSFAIPLLGGAIERRALLSGADVLRGALARARLAAMQSGQTCVVRVEPRGSRFQIVSLDKLGTPESQMARASDPDAEYSPSDMLRFARNQLPDGIVFANADIASSAQVTAMSGSSGDSSWSPPIVFRPDGTSTDASLLLQNEPGNTVRVTLRGLTGTANAGDVGREAVQ